LYVKYQRKRVERAEYVKSAEVLRYGVGTVGMGGRKEKKERRGRDTAKRANDVNYSVEVVGERGMVADQAESVLSVGKVVV
jgi:hypothetical protein